MSESISLENTTKRKHTQARGRERRLALLQAARELLNERDMGQITLPSVAEHAGIATSSTYHFYPDIRELFKDLAASIADEMINSPLDLPSPGTWEDLVRSYTKAACDFYSQDIAARQLMLGIKTDPEIKRAGCAKEAGFGDALMSLLEKYFILPALENPGQIFFRAIQIADAMFMISVEENDRLTEEYVEEACRAKVAYLELYLPKYLPRKNHLDLS
ncbi:TetR/AcrR family transcriptional regulator [Emcibacter sp.]|uniref:TetR/AcrR family transcriptional regulator n=1 Tax=Emcibacter sp. TaxID=1979954 RepID=UPI002AA6903B|nr:TetR/AcrR family transcriptional regulator [Emcibacter sp.]